MTKPRNNSTRKSIQRDLILPQRVRSIGKDGFCFVPNRFLQEGFFAALNADELLLYFLLVLAGDRNGVSWYHYDTLCVLLRMPVEQYLTARNSLIQKNLVAFDGTRFQVLELPSSPPTSKALTTPEELEEEDAATIRAIAQRSLGLRR